ncbi:hypothetical protein BJP40_10560 [Streptomyces sp. CC53]|uniref:DUF6479 family protein n=1 Tax=unclassified Streptomyces TaxID=2593676 RepID=UPI0008DC9A25|nr:MULTISPECIES: DUF6479 family protein [unclassified Streptomyces]OII60412.1 hypothetical protein BJP40_10560 [Streptomyces sp. CC53]OII70495.1 hypothetical protein BJP39_13320 [Streptomyces sp. CC77]
MNGFVYLSAEFAAPTFVRHGLGQLIAGILIVGFLIGAFWLGRRIWIKEAAPPQPEEHPQRPPDAGLPGEVEGHRKPAEVPQGERRLMPYELKHEPTEPDTSPVSEDDHKWRGSQSGGFGSGGPMTGG